MSDGTQGLNLLLQCRRERNWGPDKQVAVLEANDSHPGWVCKALEENTRALHNPYAVADRFKIRHAGMILHGAHLARAYLSRSSGIYRTTCKGQDKRDGIFQF